MMYRFLLIASWLAALSCSPTEPQTGTRTHWLQSCDSDTDCGSEDASCICNICTRPCDSDETCDGGSCSSLVSAIGLCGSSLEERICLPYELVEDCAEPLGSQNPLGEAATVDCDQADALLCESFDSPMNPNYQIEKSDTSLAAQSCLVGQGSGALSFVGNADEGFGHVQMSLAESVESGPLHLRFRAYVPSQQELPGLARIFAFRTVPEYTSEQVGLHLGASRQLRLSTGAGHENSEDDAFPLDNWFCVEAELDVDVLGSAKISIDGKRALVAKDVPTLPASGPINIGVLYGSVFNPDPSFEMAIDDVVVARSTIGCD